MPKNKTIAFKNIENLLIVVAMEIEAQSISSRFDKKTNITLHDRLKLEAVYSSFSEHEVYLVKSGIGLVNAGIATSYAIDYIKPDLILFLGVAGSLEHNLEIGDIVIADKIIQHDSKFSGENGDQLMAPGEPFLSIAPEKRASPPIFTDFEFTNLFQKKLETAGLKIRTGTILSGSEFIGSTKRKIEISKIDNKSLAVEMEAAGVSQIASKFKIPFVVIKTIADRLNADGSISADYLKFSKSAAKTAGAVLDVIISEWKQ